MVYADPADPQGKDSKRRWYEKNKKKYLDYVERTRSKVRDFLRTAKDKPCADCGQTYPYDVMDFDHKPEYRKEFQVARLPQFGSIPRAEAEIAKCDVVCSNCHRIRTHVRRTAGA